MHPPFRAPDMQGLYRKVVAGSYPDIPKTYSSDLAHIIKSMLQLNPMTRPNCQQILDNPSVQKKMKELGIDSALMSSAPDPNILGTIVFPRNLSALSSKLPKPNYAPPMAPGMPLLQKYSQISNSLQTRSKSINGIRQNNASVDCLESVKEENKERRLKSRNLRYFFTKIQFSKNKI